VIHGQRVVVVLPAFNAEKTLRLTVEGIPEGFVDDLILVDDASADQTAELSRDLGLHTVVHDSNLGYGANQKTCYREALKRGADVVIMLHPDYQYTPKLLVALASLVAIGQFDLVLGSRILSERALRGGMPIYKYISNRFLTLFENLLLGKKLSEYHTGYRAFSRELLETLPLEEN
jgi:glycosyltransferase involved in cell wall biosynthesis